MSDKGNPKGVAGSRKLPMHLWPASASALGCLGMANGAYKYGRNNYRAEEVFATIYVAACKRHLDAWLEGEEVDPDDGVPHLAAALSSIAIIVDAQCHGTLIDDRNFGNPELFRLFIDELTKHVPRLQELHKSKNPKHYTKADNGGEHGKEVRKGK